ncbi:MAG: hypothetical protein AB8C02_18470 [Halioglobus sp.]
MHIAILLLFAGGIVYLVLTRQTQSPHAASQPASDTGGETGWKRMAFISKGKLFYRSPQGQLEQIHSPYIQDVIDRTDKRKQLHGWKEDTSLGQSFTGNKQRLDADRLELQVASAQFIGEEKVLYFLQDQSFGGLFEYDIESGQERRLLHRQNLRFDDMNFDAGTGQICCAQYFDNGIANIVIMDREGDAYREVTAGDTEDSSPCWVTGQAHHILYQSAGLARSEEGYLIARGPSSIEMLDLESGEVSNVLQDSQYDYLQPRVHPGGDLYFIRRPYEKEKYDSSSLLLDTLLFPFRLLRALFHYLNFFSLMYSRKPLTTASGPKVEADLKDILVKGKRVDAQKALQKESAVHGVPSLVPGNWQLIRRSPQGEETALAGNVASFGISEEGRVLYSNGYAVFALNEGASANIVLKEKLIADVIVS